MLRTLPSSIVQLLDWIPISLLLVVAGVYWYSGTSLIGPMTETKFYWMQLSFQQAQLYLLGAIFLALLKIGSQLRNGGGG